MRVSSSARSGGLSTGHANCRTCDEGQNSPSNALYAGIDLGKLFGLAQDIGDVGITAPECIIEPNDRHSVRIAQKRKPPGQLPEVDSVGEILRSAIIAETTTDMLDRPKKTAFAITGTICALTPPAATIEEAFDPVQNDHGLRGN